MPTLTHAINWILDPVNAVITITYATAIMQAVYAETQWRWARVVGNVLAALPGVNIKGIITAAKKAQ